MNRAEYEQLKKDYDWMTAQRDMWKACSFKEAGLKDGLKAQLAKQAPLVEAANKWDGRVTDWASIKPLIQAVDDYRAALKLREEKGK